MSSQSLEALLQSVGNPVDLARNSQIGPYVYPSVPGEFSNWRDEQHAWRETCCLFDQSYHMTDMYIKGPDALKLLSALGINSFENFAVDKAKQFVACNYDGYVIGDAILFYLDDDLLNLVGRPSAHNWVQYHCETGDYDASVERDERAAVNPNNRKLYRYQVQGPNALEVLEKVNGGPLPEIKFFNLGEITIAGRKVRALHHGMSGVPGLELFGPWDDGAEVKAAIVEAGEEFGLAQVGSRVYATNTLESGWIPCPLPAIFTGEEMKAYREWLPAKGYEGTGSLGGSFYSDDIADYYLTPYDLGYGSFVKFDHDFIGREALEAMSASPPRKKVTLAWNGDDVARAMGTMFQQRRPRQVHRPAALQLLDLAERQDHEGRRDGRRLDVLGLQLQRELDAVARDRRRRAERAGHRGDARLGRGGRRVGEAGGRAPRADRDPRDSSRRFPTPRSSAPRTGRSRRERRPATSSCSASYWTVSGPVEVHVGREWSLFDWADRCAEARKVGFSGLGIWHADLEHVLETRSLQEMKRVFDDNGLRHLELEFLMDWFLDSGRRAASGLRRDPRAALPTLPPSSTRTTSRSATSRARRPSSRSSPSASRSSAPTPPNRTDAKIVYEFMPFDVNVRSVDAVLEVVGGAGAANGGIAIDTWHMSKLGIAPDELRRIPLEYLSWVELSDGRLDDMDDLDRRDRQPSQAARRGRVRHPRLHRGLRATTATPGPGASRCSPRSCATSRST